MHTSDHFLITANLALTPEAAHTPTQVTFRLNLCSLSPSRLSSVVSSSLPSLSQFSALDTNSATDTLCSTLTSCLDNFCPLSSRPARTTPSAPWLSEVLREHRSKLRAAERKWHKSRNSNDLSVYQSLLSSFSANVFTAKTSYYHNKINNCCDARTLFKTFSSLLNPPPPPPPLILTADDFAVFFTNKTRTISDQFSTPQTEDNFTTTNAHSLSSFSPLSETDVSKLILSSHPTTCPLDPIPTHLLQAISSSVIPSLTHIINSALHSGTFPSAFKQARVSPLLKKPSLNPALLENYRPVSLLPFIAKTLERAVFNQLSMFLVQNNLLDSNQSGFKSGHSTETALLSVTEALRLARAASKSSVLILLDLSAAFDTVNHQILLSTLRKMGISGTALQWLNSYLSDRSFMVSWRGEVSKSQQLATGVPQGSVLGPLLFSIYMTSLGSVIQKHGFSYHCYADDTQLYFSFQPDDPTVVARISACLSDISSWMNDHHLQLNLTKTELLVVPANPSFHHNFSIQLGSSTITPSRTARNLGVVMDYQLSFTVNIATTTRSCRFALYNIRKIRPFLSEQATQLLVQALVLSRLDYCNALLAGLPACTIKPLQLIQNAAVRVVFNEPKTAHVTPHQVTLATSSYSHQIQGIDACLQDNHWHGTNIPKLTSSILCALQKFALCK
uniref:Reverse transcriptase domain-containing protein n=1 Tax=Cyprinus carpio TaxID=7962 RepID=A0A8C2BQ02_CYPCA